jgi:hypothetical protein
LWHEIRALALRGATAATRIKDLIGEFEKSD